MAEENMEATSANTTFDFNTFIKILILGDYPFKSATHPNITKYYYVEKMKILQGFT